MLVTKIDSGTLHMLSELGFSIREREKHYTVFLPDNWYFYLVDKNTQLLVDEKNRRRGIYTVKETKKWLKGEIKLYPRYVIKKDSKSIYIYDNEEGKVKISYEYEPLRPFEKARGFKLLVNYLDRVFPEWNNPMEYWN